MSCVTFLLRVRVLCRRFCLRQRQTVFACFACRIVCTLVITRLGHGLATSYFHSLAPAETSTEQEPSGFCFLCFRETSPSSNTLELSMPGVKTFRPCIKPSKLRSDHFDVSSQSHNQANTLKPQRWPSEMCQIKKLVCTQGNSSNQTIT